MPAIRKIERFSVPIFISMTFTCNHLAETFIQSNLQVMQITIKVKQLGIKALDHGSNRRARAVLGFKTHNIHTNHLRTSFHIMNKSYNDKNSINIQYIVYLKVDLANK